MSIHFGSECAFSFLDKKKAFWENNKQSKPCGLEPKADNILVRWNGTSQIYFYLKIEIKDSPYCQIVKKLNVLATNFLIKNQWKKSLHPYELNPWPHDMDRGCQSLGQLLSSTTHRKYRVFPYFVLYFYSWFTK